MKRLLLITLFNFLSLFLISEQAFAQVNPSQIIKVSPSILNISLSPGNEYSYTVKVTNLTLVPLPVRAGFENFTTTDEEGGFVFESPTKNPMSSWVSLDTKDMIIPAGSERTVELNVKIPDKVPFGGYYMVLFFEPLLSAQQTGGANIAAKIGVLMLSNIGTTDSQANAKILTFEPNPFVLRVQNNGINHFSAKPFLKLKNILGSEKSIELEEKFVFPGKVRRWEKNVDLPKMPGGIYKANIVVATGEGKQINMDKYFVNLPVSKGLLIILTITIIIIIIAKRRNIRKALRVLVLNK